MKFIERFLPVWSLEKKELAPKMIFIDGPRQSGKSTLLERFLEQQDCSPLLYNWDTLLPPAKDGPTFRRKSDPLDRQNTDENFRILNPSDFFFFTCDEKTIDK
jgi:pantothenate kinase-related protein Tda10